MDEFSAFLKAIPSAAASPLALVAYLAAVGAWLAIAWRLKIVQAGEAVLRTVHFGSFASFRRWRPPR